MHSHYRGIKHKITTPAPSNIGVVLGIPRRLAVKVAEVVTLKDKQIIFPKSGAFKVSQQRRATLLKRVDRPYLVSDACLVMDTRQISVLAQTNARSVTIGPMHGTIVQSDLETRTGVIVLSIGSR